MTNTTQSKKQLPAFLILGIIALVAAVVLAATNMVTRGPIAELQMAELKAAFGSVLTADEYVEMTVDESYNVSSLYEAKTGGETVGWCVTASANGYGGAVAVTLGVDVNGAITGCVVGDLNFSETAGYGSRAKEPAFQNQFKGVNVIDGGTLAGLSGASLTTNAVKTASNNALRCVAALGLQQTPAAEEIITFGK